MLDELKAILAADIAEPDPHKLAAALYDRCYTESILDPPPRRAAVATPDDLTAQLVVANQSQSSWDEGWAIDQLLSDGRILARKTGAARSFLPGEYVTHRGIGSGAAPGARISVLISAGSTDLQPGFYYAFSETVSEFDESEWTLRFFWNVTCAGAPRLVDLITREFNRFQIPFRFKCLNRASSFPRRDAAVLYCHARYYPIAALVIESVHAQVSALLNASTPLFAKRLAPGLALAEDPGESFGENRMRLLAAALLAGEGKSVEGRLAEVREQFAGRGLSFEQPWLNPGSVDRYEFPFPAA